MCVVALCARPCAPSPAPAALLPGRPSPEALDIAFDTHMKDHRHIARWLSRPVQGLPSQSCAIPRTMRVFDLKGG
jgi:hypothetical protein